MFYTAPEQIEERVKIIANTDEGCIVETLDGYAINIGPCDFDPDEYVIAPIDQKTQGTCGVDEPNPLIFFFYFVSETTLNPDNSVYYQVLNALCKFLI